MDTGTVKIFASSDVPRLRYIAGILLGEIMGLHWEIVTDKRKIGRSPVINYSSEDLKGAFRILPDTLLFETGLKNNEPVISTWNNLPVFFITPEGSDLPFDIFAASFFLVSRYEEYLDHDQDSHGRFSAHSSFSFRNGFLHKPVIDLWVKEWTKMLVVKLHTLVFRKNTFKSMVTVDIDQPFAFLGKNVLRNIGGLIRDISTGEGKATEHYRTITKGENDPWDVFDYILDEIYGSGIDGRFFIPVGDRSPWDRNPSWRSDDYRKLIARVSRRFPCGLHPSFNASTDLPKLKSEKERLEKILPSGVDFSRFHYLNLKFPSSLKNLLDAGIKEDYTLGYHDEPGFRAGIARPFVFYDIHEERETTLRMIPFQVMDGTFIQYKMMNPSDAGQMISGLIGETKNAGGLFISIWHNTTLLDSREGREWREVFESMLKQLT